MPVPSPNTSETRSQFVSRCISVLTREDPERSNDQVIAICMSQWRGESVHTDFQRILNTFVRYFKSVEAGVEKFTKFVSDNGLNVSKPYHPAAQFKEGFQWIEGPLITFYKKDKNAKYYKLRAITANISMNNNDYRDYQKLVVTAPSFACQPVNINHDHTRWLPFPRTRIDYTNAEDLSIEATLRVDNKDDWLQKELDMLNIIQPSIEGYRDKNLDIHGTGMALLEKGVQLPGDPLSEILPVFLNESIGKGLCKIVEGKVVCENTPVEVKIMNKTEVSPCEKIVSEQKDKIKELEKTNTQLNAKFTTVTNDLHTEIIEKAQMKGKYEADISGQRIQIKELEARTKELIEQMTEFKGKIQEALEERNETLKKNTGLSEDLMTKQEDIAKCYRERKELSEKYTVKCKSEEMHDQYLNEARDELKKEKSVRKIVTSLAEKAGATHVNDDGKLISLRDYIGDLLKAK